MNRLQSTNTTSELKDSFKKERREMLLSLSKNYENQMNNYNSNQSQNIVHNKYNFDDISFNNLNSQKNPYPYTDIEKDDYKIKSFSENNNVNNFIPFPENTRNFENEIENKVEEKKQNNVFMQKINNEPHPKKLYMDAQESNNLLDSKLTTIEYKPVDLNNMGEFNNS